MTALTNWNYISALVVQLYFNIYGFICMYDTEELDSILKFDAIKCCNIVSVSNVHHLKKNLSSFAWIRLWKDSAWVNLVLLINTEWMPTWKEQMVT